MGSPRTGPENYPSNFAAILDLIRFGFGTWKPARMAVLLFHIERSTAYGWQSDQHSESQATAGIYSRELRKWIRGPAGVSQKTYHRQNKELVAAGLLTRLKRRTPKGGHAASEFAPNWLAIRAALTEWKETTAPPFCHGDRRASVAETVPFCPGDRRASVTVTDTVVE